MIGKIDCLVVDDEPIAREIILAYCSHLPLINVVASCGNALEAKAIMHHRRIDLLFLDIDMPVLSGIAFLKTIRNQPQVIFTTAYKEYALDAFDLAACDYLLKPFSLERFIVAVDKAMTRLALPAAATQEPEKSGTTDYMFIKTDGKIYKVFYSDLLFAEASGNYTKVVTAKNILLPAMTFSAFEESVPAAVFIRVHRSFIVNKARITHIEGNRIFINETGIPVGSSYKENFLATLGF